MAFLDGIVGGSLWESPQKTASGSAVSLFCLFFTATCIPLEVQLTYSCSAASQLARGPSGSFNDQRLELLECVPLLAQLYSSCVCAN